MPAHGYSDRHFVTGASGFGMCRGKAFPDTRLNNTHALSGRDGSVDETTRGECLTPTPAICLRGPTYPVLTARLALEANGCKISAKHPTKEASPCHKIFHRKLAPLLEPTLAGPEWVTGGAFGPEGSLVTTAVLALATIWIWRTSRLRPGRKAIEARPLILAGSTREASSAQGQGPEET